MKTYPFLITEDSVVIFKQGKRLIANKSHPNFDLIIQKVREGKWSHIEDHFDVREKVQRYFKVEIKGNQVSYNGKPLHNVLTSKILVFLKEGLPYKPLVKFLDKLMQNPSQQSVDSLYTYLERHKLPITEDGDFIAVKCVRSNWKDKHSGKIDNRVGKVISMQRQNVDPGLDECAGPGLHVGSSCYIRGYRDSEDRMILVKINPKDVVVVPREQGFGKIRVCRYKVINELQQDIEFSHDYAPRNSQYNRDQYGRFVGSTSLRLARPKSPKRDKLGRFC